MKDASILLVYAAYMRYIWDVQHDCPLMPHVYTAYVYNYNCDENIVLNLEIIPKL